MYFAGHLMFLNSAGRVMFLYFAGYVIFLTFARRVLFLYLGHGSSFPARVIVARHTVLWKISRNHHYFALPNLLFVTKNADKMSLSSTNVYKSTRHVPSCLFGIRALGAVPIALIRWYASGPIAAGSVAKAPSRRFTAQFSCVGKRVSRRSFDDQCHALMSCWDFLGDAASTRTPASRRKHQQSQRCRLRHSGWGHEAPVKALPLPAGWPKFLRQAMYSFCV